MPRLELVAELIGHEDKVWQVSWNINGTLLASCSGDKTVRLWDTKLWICTNILEGTHNRTIRSVSWSPDGKQIATASFDSTTGVWERDPRAGDFECVATLEGHENETKSVAWSPSGSLLATCSRDKSVWIWGVEGNNDFDCLSVLQEHTQDVKMVLWHPNDEILASASYDDTIKIWREDDDDWYCSDTLEGHTSTVWSIDFDQTGNHLVSGSDDQTIKIWRRYLPNNSEGVQTPRNEPKWKNICTLSGYHERCIYSVSWSKVHSRIASASGDNTLRVFEQNQPSQDPNAPNFSLITSIESAHGLADVNSVAWFPTENNGDWLASGGDDGIVRIWRFVE